MEKMKFKNVIVGWGKGGKTLAKFLAERGESVAVIEASPKMYGGTCINIACIPSKYLIVRSERGMDFADAAAQKATFIAGLNHKNYHNLADEEFVTVINGRARFVANHELEVTAGTDKVRVVGERLFINTGAKPVLPELLGLVGNPDVLTSTELLDLKEQPKKLAIIGAGYISLEFASMFVDYGSEVAVFDVREEFLAREDRDLADRVKSDLEARGVSFHAPVELQEIREKTLFYKQNDATHHFKFDKLLVATGRKANTENLGLENTSIQLNTRGEIIVNDILETTAAQVWAIGDVHGGAQFTYTSLDDFRILKNQLYGDKSRRLSDRGAVPTSVFIRPTLSSVGLNEQAAQALDKPYRLFKLATSAIVKANVLGEPQGLLKALVDPETDEILGATIYAPESHELINLLSLAIKAKIPYGMIRDQIFTHPTISEGLNDLFADANEVK
ncbi:FAD-dependent oxidoreductase [Lactococcus taiwanensis]|uniref:FAD-dependent oxidoreductase n=1 Tax=Lactococcus taiwanensis TaxID=1151742 RepID=UPI0028A2CBD0|nr:FAD-dependent oxidoreductase [Lactococcus taiwanensis]